MLRRHGFVPGSLLGLASLLSLVGCAPPPTEGPSTTQSAPTAGAPDEAAAASTDENEHAHEKGAHGGIIISLGRDSYHVEAIVTNRGELRLYTLGNDETRVMEIAAQELSGFAKLAGESDSVPITLKPQPQPGDSEGKASLFVGGLPAEFVGKSIDVTVPSISIEGERFRLGFTTESAPHAGHDGDSMPEKVADGEERELYLTPGGIYTEADIQANGRITGSQKFAGFQAAHDLKPKEGDKICPITLTKANPQCSWIIGGKTYEFCCPPCVDEFLTLAKTKPEEVKAPEDYVKGGSQP